MIEITGLTKVYKMPGGKKGVSLSDYPFFVAFCCRYVPWKIRHFTSLQIHSAS